MFGDLLTLAVAVTVIAVGVHLFKKIFDPSNW